MQECLSVVEKTTRRPGAGRREPASSAFRNGTPWARRGAPGAYVVGVRGRDVGGRARGAGSLRRRRAGAGAGGRARDAGGRRAGAVAGDRVRVWAGTGPAAETLGSLTASEEEDSAQTMTPVRFLLFILGTICRGGS